MNDIELKILIALHRNVSKLDRMTSTIASEHQVTFSQFMVLEALYSIGDMTVGAVRDHILSSVGTISLIVNNLVKMGYVERLSDKHDRRICILHLTPAGYEVISQIAPKNEKMIIEYMSVLNQEEKKQLFSLLRRIGGKINGAKN